MSREAFRTGNTYDNVYFLFVDASGYSSIVRLNPRDRAAHAFDQLRDRVVSRVHRLADQHGCERAVLWSWRGDGGFLVIHDDNESTARTVALQAARTLLTVDIPELREELRPAELRGELHVRMAVHKGPIRYAVENDTDAIHSPDINFAAHLEEATPRDCLAISEDVHRVAGDLADLFEPVGAYEGQHVYLMRPRGATSDGRRAWLRTTGLDGRTPVQAYAQRPSQQEKARLIEVAASEIVDLGTALNTCAGYLVTTERPAIFRDAVLDFFRRGGIYRCVLLDPTCEAVEIYARLRQEDLAAKIKGALAKFARFKERYGAAAEGLHVYQTDEFPGMAALCVDLRTPQALVLYSPYLLGIRTTKPLVERADMPHYLASPDAGPLFSMLTDVIGNAISGDVLYRVL